MLSSSRMTFLGTELSAPHWTIRPEQPLDLDQIHELHRASFPGPAEAELVDAIRATPSFVPDLSLVAVTADGTVLGHVLVSRVGFQADGPEAGRADALALAPIAVLAPHRGRGIGSALVEAALAVADARDERFTAVLGAPSFYGPFGFSPAAASGVRGPYADAGDAFAVRPRPGARVEAGALLYPAPFGEL